MVGTIARIRLFFKLLITMKDQIRHIWTVICQKSSIDANSNLLSLFEVLEKVDINLNPAVQSIPEDQVLSIPFNFEIISYWRKGTHSRGEGKLRLTSPEGKQLNEVPFEVIIPENSQAYRVVAKVNGLSFTTSGEYKIEVLQKVGKDFKVVAEVPFDIAVHKQ